MIRRLVAPVLLLASLSICLAGPKFDTKPLSKIEIRNSDLNLVVTITRKSDISEILNCLSRASKISDTSFSTEKYSHRIDIEDRWLYDDSSGTFTVLTKSVAPIFQVTEDDKLHIRSFLQIGKAEQDAAANP